MFTEAFIQRAILAALVLSPLCAVLGVFVTARKMAFFSDTISHAALAGVALGLWWGMSEPTIPMILFSLLVAAAILWLKENTDLLTDTIMALLLSGSVAFAIIVFSFLKGYRADLHRYLFGDILAISPNEVVLAYVLFVLVMGWVFTQLSALTLLTAQEEMAHVCGVPVRRLNYLFVAVLTVSVAMSIRLLGIILVTSLVVIPAATARNISQNLRQQIIFSLMVGWIGGLAGTGLAIQLDLPTGPAIVLVCIGLFMVSLGIRALRSDRAPAR